MKLNKNKDKSYGLYKEYIHILLEDSGDMSELPQIKQLAVKLTLANKMTDLERAFLHSKDRHCQ